MTDKVTAFQKELVLYGVFWKCPPGDISVVPSVHLKLEIEFSSLLKALPNSFSMGFEPVS